jgi:hypothetical protein
MKSPALWTAHRGTITSDTGAPVASQPSLQQMLESIVVANWKDLMPEQDKGLVDVEFRLRPDRSLEYLRLWAASRRGFCDLICQYSMFWRWSTTEEVNFGIGYDSKSLADALGYVLQNQSSFANTSATVNEMVHVSAPTEEQKDSAGKFISAVYKLPVTAVRTN